jgi:hypothetical protein
MRHDGMTTIAAPRSPNVSLSRPVITARRTTEGKIYTPTMA